MLQDAGGCKRLMANNFRTGRMGAEIQRILSNCLAREIKDTTLKENMISITAVDVTRDGSYATVYFTAIPLGVQDEKNIDELDAQIIDAFQRSKGFLKKAIAREMKLRHIPELSFKKDISLENGRHIDELINSL